jgi:glycosyltransferase involved in cell wall biosynthesis
MRRDGPFDIVHGYWALPSGLAAAVAGRRLRIPSVVTLDSGELVALRDIGYGLQCRAAQRLAVAATLRLATAVTVCTGYMERIAVDHGAHPYVIPLGVDAALFHPVELPEGPPWRLLHVASLNRVKEQPTLLEAFRRVRARIPDVRLDILGADTLDGAVQSEATRLGLAGHVIFHGVQPSAAVARHCQRAHLAVMASRHEAAGVAALEAAACRVATVGTAVGYLADWTPHAAVGVPVGDVQGLADSIVALLADLPRRRRISAAARQRSLACDADWTAERMTELYDEILARSKT